MLDDKKDVSKAEVQVAKGVQKSVIFNDLRFSTYLNCLWNNEVKEHNFKTICSMSSIYHRHIEHFFHISCWKYCF